MKAESQPELFENRNGPKAASAGRYRPLAIRMRPTDFDDIVGQRHLFGRDAALPRLAATGAFSGVILCGPPGSGKTTIAELIAERLGGRIVRLNAVLSNVAELRDVLKAARFESGTATTVFIDEIHRFNKAQQDLLLPDVEAGNIRLIGATTQNPGFYVNPPLLSRSHLFRLEPLGVNDVVTVLLRAATDIDRGMGAHRVRVSEEIAGHLAALCNGDLRQALNALETLVQAAPMGGELALADLEAYAAQRQIRFDRDGDEHYDTASALIKSIRGSDPDAAVYWLAKMLEGGEDPRFIARRLVILASEDVGLADSRALPLAMAAFHACESIGSPECQLNLSHCALFLALCPKSNSATLAVAAARDAVRRGPVQAVPAWLRDAHTSSFKSVDEPVYRYDHDEFDHVAVGQQFLLDPKAFYEPTQQGSEKALGERHRKLRRMRYGM